MRKLWIILAIAILAASAFYLVFGRLHFRYAERDKLLESPVFQKDLAAACRRLSEGAPEKGYEMTKGDPKIPKEITALKPFRVAVRPWAVTVYYELRDGIVARNLLYPKESFWEITTTGEAPHGFFYRDDEEDFRKRTGKSFNDAWKEMLDAK